MKKIYIFGMGKGKEFVDRCLLRDQVECVGYVNNFCSDSERVIDGIPIIRQDELKMECDYIIITLMQYKNTKQELICQGIKSEKIICYFDFYDADNEKFWSILDSYKWRTELMWRHYMNILMPTLNNLNYEIYWDAKDIREQCPKVVDVDETVEILSNQKKSLARLGDGEFELIRGHMRQNFQFADTKISERLKEVLRSENDNLMVAIADNYLRLDKYTDEGAEAIRSYLSKEIRKQHMEILKPGREYYNAYISRPYMIFRDKRKAGKRFENIRKIWDGQDVLIVEGEYTRFGVGNDLLDNSSMVSRILAPAKNAFSKYDEIIEEVRQHGRDKLILAILGPTATVLAYDLSKEGYWIIDIGQLDVEYEWYLRGAEERCDIPYKTVSEVMQYSDILTDESKEYIRRYQSEIIAQI